MKTTTYNPSPLEVDFANALHILQEQIQKHLQDNKIVNVESNLNRDNPMVKFSILNMPMNVKSAKVIYLKNRK